MDATQNDSAIAADPETAAQDAVAEPVAEPTAEAAAETPEAPEEAADSPAEDVPAPRAAEPEPAKTKKRKAAPKSKTAAGTKSLVVFREGKVHYADETVVVLDLDDAAHPDTDVHDVVDKLSELRDAVESPGRAEAVSLVAELIQTKALA
ncbi:MAG TPA: hypothetical protein VFN97_00485 [Actinospica sp.]|nr:hypothetical protein [Actinospica sp.]